MNYKDAKRDNKNNQTLLRTDNQGQFEKGHGKEYQISEVYCLKGNKRNIYLKIF